jgi:hypothetical protein
MSKHHSVVGSAINFVLSVIVIMFFAVIGVGVSCMACIGIMSH